LSVYGPHLGNGDGDLSDAGVKHLVLETVGMAVALLGSFMRGCPQVLLALDLHGGVE